ncbi:MAG: hypothetical protein HY619_01010, partial [Thaumarchaeota archaeon]|nr:hypothetical protein [Nitrososphaerota archaeon]
MSRIKAQKLSAETTLLLILISFFTALLFAQMLKYPYFPSTPSDDYFFHLSQALQASKGSLNPLQATYPPAVHYLIALGTIILPLPATQTMTITMIIAASIIPILVYSTTTELSKDRRLAVLATAIYITANPVWRISLFTGGFYANHLADLLSLTVLYLLTRYARRGETRLLPLLLITSLVLLASHFTVPVFIIALWAFTPILLTKKQELKRYLTGCTLITLPALAILALRPDLIPRLMAVPALTSGIVIGDINPTLASASPFLAFLTTLIPTPLLILTATGLAATLADKTSLRRNPWTLLPAVWFIIPMILSPLSELASRFALYALLPLTLLIPQALASLIKSAARLGNHLPASKHLTKLPTLALTIIIIAAIAPTSPLIQHANDISTSITETRILQESILDTITQIKENTPPETTFASIGRWELMYLPLLAERRHVGDYLLTPQQMHPTATSLGADYVTVWKGLTLNREYASSKLYEELWSNQAIAIY